MRVPFDLPGSQTQDSSQEPQHCKMLLLSNLSDEVTLIDFSTSPLRADTPKASSLSASHFYDAAQLLDDDQITVCDAPLSPYRLTTTTTRQQSPSTHRMLSHRGTQAQGFDSHKALANSDSGFFDSEETSLIDLDNLAEGVQNQNAESTTHTSELPKDHTATNEKYYGKQKFFFHDIHDNRFSGSATSLPNNQVVVEADKGDEIYTITYDPDEMARIEETTWQDQSLKWRDKFTPKYSVLRQKPRIVERYVAKYSKLARKQSKWSKGIYRCFDAEDEEEEAVPEVKHFTEIENGERSRKRRCTVQEMDVDASMTELPRLHAIEIANLIPETLADDVEVRRNRCKVVKRP